jgi:hypothetical protein
MPSPWRRAAAGLLTAAIGLGGLAGSLIVVKLARGDGSLDQRRAAIQDMEAAEQERLRRNFDRFSDLPPAEQERLHRLHEAIERESNADELRAVMDRYFEWLKTLSALERAELKDLPPEARIKRIGEIKQEQARREEERNLMGNPRGDWLGDAMRNQGGRAPSPEDLPGLFRWIEEVAPKYEARFLESIPEDGRQQARDELKKAGSPGREQDVLGQMWLRWQMWHPGELPPVTDEEFKSLRDKLTEETRQWLVEKSDADQRKVLTGWIRFLVMQKFAFRRGGPRFQAASEKELAKFLETISPDERDRLLSLPGEEMRRQLMWAYMRSKMPELPSFYHPGGRSWPGSRGGFGPRREGPPGGGRPAQPGDLPPQGPGNRGAGEGKPSEPPGEPIGDGPPRPPHRPENGPGAAERLPEPPPR